MKYLLFLCLFGIFNQHTYADQIIEIPNGDGGISQEDIDAAIREELILSGGSGALAAGSGTYTYKTIKRNGRLQQAMDNLQTRVGRISDQNEKERERYRKSSARVQKKNPLTTQSSSWTMDRMRNFRNARGKKWYSPNRLKLPVSGIVTAAGSGYSLIRLYAGFQISIDEIDEIAEDCNCARDDLEGLPLNDDDFLELGEGLGGDVYIYKEENQ